MAEGLQVDPPRGSGISHTRKIDSYRVEAAFYRDVVPAMHSAGPEAAAAHCPTPRPFLVKAASTSFLFVLSDIAESYPEERHSLDLQEALVALEWLAAFHATHWELPTGKGLWGDACYWHLATRQDELRAIGSRWGELKQHAGAIDDAISSASPWAAPAAGGIGDDGDGGAAGAAAAARRHRTLCHGDFKSANFVFTRDGAACAAYDFQYVGAGYGMKDVAYLLCSSVDEDVLTHHEAQLLDSYHTRLQHHLSSPEGAASSASASDGAPPGRHQQHRGSSYSREVMQRHYELCLLDYCRFMAGWGWWGAAGWAQQRAREILPRLPQLLREQQRERADDLL